jgi:hypothetical protein
MGSRRLLGRRVRRHAARRRSSGLSSSGSKSSDRADCRDRWRRFRRGGSTGRAHRTAASSGLAYCGESGQFHDNHWDISDGMTERRAAFQRLALDREGYRRFHPWYAETYSIWAPARQLPKNPYSIVEVAMSSCASSAHSKT